MPDVYAVGECAEHRGRVYGLVAPLWEQAQVLADRLSRQKSATPSTPGRRPSTKLKVTGVDLAVMGDKEPVEEDDEVVSYTEPSRGIYKKLVVRNDRLAGAIVLGDGGDRAVAAAAVRRASAVPENRAELLFRADRPSPPPSAAKPLPDTAQICNCNGVTKAQIIEAVLRGARSVRGVCERPVRAPDAARAGPRSQAIVELACQGLASPALLAAGEHAVDLPEAVLPADGRVVVTHNKIERYKSEKDGLDIVADDPASRAGRLAGDRRRRSRAAEVGGRVLPPSDARPLHDARPDVERPDERRAAQNARARSGRSSAPDSSDITTRQQIQLRGFEIEHVPEIWERLAAVGLVSLQTGMDNIRNVVGCPVAGLTRHELFDASPVVREFTESVPANKAIHEPAAEVQRRDYRLHRALHARRIAGSGADAGGQDRSRARRSRAST